MNTILEPVRNDSVTRWSKWKNPSAADACRIWAPYLEAVCLSAKVPTARATEWLQAQSPEAITPDAVAEFVRSITEPPTDVLAAARARQAQIDADIASERPLTARDRVLLERKQPLTQRSRQSIEDELYEADTCKTRAGVELPDLSREQWAALEPHYKALDQELERRDCIALGAPYRAPANRTRPDLSGVMPMRG